MVEYLGLGDEIDYKTFNGLIYLLRKFKRLTSDLRLGASVISTDYGTLSFTGGLTSLGGNFIIESPVTVSANDCLRNCFYSLHFTVIDRNLSGTVNRRIETVTGDTGEDGVLEVTIPTDFIESDEVILPDFKLDIVFDEHEYYTPLNVVNIELESNKIGIIEGETITITATVTDKAEGNPVIGLNVPLRIDGARYEAITDSDGVATYTYTGGVEQKEILVKVLGKTLIFYQNYLIATAEGSNVYFGDTEPGSWIGSEGSITIDWGDGTKNVIEPHTKRISHSYVDGKNTHTIVFHGKVTYLEAFAYDFGGHHPLSSIILPNTITSLGWRAFKGCSNLTSINLPSSLTSLGQQCFDGCTGLTSVVIPDSVTSLGGYCFRNCSALVDYQLYWEPSDSIITYDSNKMPNNSGTVFTIPYGTTSQYTAKSYPSNKLTERSPVPDTLTVTADKPIIQSTETSTITATLTDNGAGVAGETLNYEIKHGDTTITTGSDTTDSNGEINITYTGTGTGEISIIVSYGTLLQETYEVYDYIAMDKGTQSEHSDIWTGNTSELTRQSDSSLFSSTSSRYIDTDTLITGDFEATFEAIGTNAPMWGVVDETKTYRTRAYFRNDATFLYYKLTRQNGVITFKYSSDGTNWNVISAQSSEITTEPCYFRFHNNSGTKSITFKNLLIYPV